MTDGHERAADYTAGDDDATVASRRNVLQAAALGTGLSVAGPAVSTASAQDTTGYGAAGYGEGGYGGTTQSQFSRFDTNQNGQIDFLEVLNAIGAFNSGQQIGGQSVSFLDVLGVIGDFNSQ